MKTPIYFRADGHSQMGLGHVIRSLALASTLSSRFDCKFIIQNPTSSVRQLIQEVCTDIIELPETRSLSKEVEKLTKTVFVGTEIVVLDGYHFDAEYQQQLKPHIGKMVCIDDIHATHFHSDVLINHAAGILPEDYSANTSTRLYLGFNYLLLRKPFLNRITNKQSFCKQENVFICLGGADPNNDTIPVLQKAITKMPKGHFFVIIGAAYQYRKALLEFKQSNSSKITILQNLDAESLANLMQQCGTAITSPSTVALEYIAIGGHLYLHPIADNQSRIFNFLTASKAGFDVKQFGEIETKILNQSKLIQKTLIDGKSHKRLTDIFKELDFEIHGKLRHATVNDADDYFYLANDRLTRQYSFSDQKIPLTTHIHWFHNKRVDPNTRMYVLEIQGQFAGQIRFDFDQKATLSYSLAAPFRGRGLGKFLLKKGIEKFKTEVNSNLEIEGFVKKENIASNQIFMQFDFQQTEVSTMPHAWRYFKFPIKA